MPLQQEREGKEASMALMVEEVLEGTVLMVDLEGGIASIVEGETALIVDWEEGIVLILVEAAETVLMEVEVEEGIALMEGEVGEAALMEEEEEEYLQ